MVLMIPVSIGELFDKISILEIKLAKISMTERKKLIEYEFDQLIKISKQQGYSQFFEHTDYNDLKEVNCRLWKICEERRMFEAAKQFDEEFIAASRMEYKLNDQRARIKAKINKKFDSQIVEVKSYNSLRGAQR